MPGRPRRLKEWQVAISKALAPIVPNAAREAQLMLMHLLECDELFLLLHAEDELKERAKLLEMVRRRLQNEPLEYITNSVDFYGEKFYIDAGALIPRPETELLVDEVLKRLSKESDAHIVEVGVGSAVVCIMLAKRLPNATFTATDISTEALRVAKRNIQKHGLQDRIKLVHTNLLDGVNVSIDYLVSNPPYIEEGLFLESNLSYEPQNALFGGKRGDEIIRELINQALKRKIRFFSCETGYDQKDTISDYLRQYPYKRLDFYKDYAGFDRGFTLELEE